MSRDAIDRTLSSILDRLENGSFVDLEEEIRVNESIAHELRRALRSMLDGMRGLGTIPAGALVYPEEIAGFRVLQRIGRGGEGSSVLLAEDGATGRRIALKVLPEGMDERRLQRFQKQMRFAAELDHPHVVRVYAAGESEGMQYIAMELMRGGSLARLIAAVAGQGGTLPADVVRRFAVETELPRAAIRRRSYQRAIAEALGGIAGALHEAHGLDLLHRDVKPSNILLTGDGTAKLADFGLARRTVDAHITRTGESPGTRPYMAPEQLDARFGALDHRADVYALGVTLYEAVTLERPHRGANDADLTQRIRQRDPVAPRRRNPDLHPDLGAVIMRCLQKNPAHRYTTAQELAEELARFARGEPVRTRRLPLPVLLWRRAQRRPAVVATAVAGLLVVSVFCVVLAVMAAAWRRDQHAAYESFRRLAAGEHEIATDARQRLDFVRLREAAGAAMRNRVRAIRSARSIDDCREPLLGIIESALLAGDLRGARNVVERIREFDPDWADERWLELRAEVGLRVGEGEPLADAMASLVALVHRVGDDPHEARRRRLRDRIAAELARRTELPLPGPGPCVTHADALELDAFQPVVLSGGEVVLWRPRDTATEPGGELAWTSRIPRPANGAWDTARMVWTRS